LASRGDERRGSLRYAPASRQPDYDPEISEWGNPPARVFIREFIAYGSERRELKHLSTCRKRERHLFRQ
jgi:hypothetical protein